MGTANIVSMQAQPVRRSFLCFDIGGILDTCTAQLGGPVNSIAYQKLSQAVRTAGTMSGDPSRLRFDAEGLVQFAEKFSLASLRNEDRKALVDSAVNSRQNVYFSKHANAASVISTIKGTYAKTSPASNANLLAILGDLAQQQATQLQNAYMEDDRTGVVRATTSTVDTASSSYGAAQRIGKFYQESVARAYGNGSNVPAQPWEGVDRNKGVWYSGYTAANFKSVPAGTRPVQTTGVNYELSDNSNTARGTQSATHVDFEYRTPYLEAQARNLRAQISLNDQQFNLFMLGQNIPNLEQIFNNELASVDNDVYQLQLALLRTFLIAPQPGTVTGIYKSPGEKVDAGEPILRVEDHGVVHLVATLVHYGPIAIGATATVTTTLAGAAGGTTSVAGNVVAARVLDSGGRWETIVQVANLDGGGQFILPPGYHFDAEYTTVTIV